MRRRRQHLQVSTFPFLAVLLCAMGALILVLMVMDRKGKKAAHARAQARASKLLDQHQREYDQQVAQRQRDVEARKRDQQLAHDQKRDALALRLAAEEQALEQELAEIQARLAEASKKLHADEGGLDELRKQLETEKARLEKQEREVTAARLDARGAARKASASDEARTKLTAELARLEKHLAGLTQKRKKDAHTYSVVPYHGKHGESRRPVYIECNATGYIFHPEKKSQAAKDEVRDELKRRLAIQKEMLVAAGVADAKPYILLIVRPDGIDRYWEMQKTARDLGVEFGYEFIEADWVLNFPEDKVIPGAAPATVQAPTPVKPSPRESVSVLPGSKQGDAGVPGVGQGTPGGVPSLGTPLPVPGGMAGAPGGQGDSPGAMLVPPVVVSSGGVPGKPSLDGLGGGTPAPKPEKEGIVAPPLLPSLNGNEPGAKAVASGSAPDQGKREPKKDGDRLGPATPEPEAPPPRQLRPARISGESEAIIFVECRGDVVFVHPARKPIAIESLNHSPAHNPLVQAVRLQVARRQGANTTVHIRFLVHRDSERTFHLAYPALDSVNVSKSRYTLQSWDKVEQIVSEY